MICDPRKFRQALGSFATGITIVTASGPQQTLLGITANSFNSVSMDPPLVLFSLSKKAYSLRAFLSSRHFAVNVLSEEQEALSARFAVALGEKWKDTRYQLSANGCPFFPGSLAVFDCHIHHTYEGGDHVILVGAVDSFQHDPKKRPLLYYQGKYSRIQSGEAPPQQGKSTAADCR